MDESAGLGAGSSSEREKGPQRGPPGRPARASLQGAGTARYLLEPLETQLQAEPDHRTSCVISRDVKEGQVEGQAGLPRAPLTEGRSQRPQQETEVVGTCMEASQGKIKEPKTDQLQNRTGRE